jgi:hypothetical protein
LNRKGAKLKKPAADAACRKAVQMLKAIYVFFIGLLTAVVIGTGIAAFYPAPKAPDTVNVDQSPQREREQQRRWDAYSKVRQSYDRNASIIAFASGLLIGIAALGFSAKIPVIGDGSLLGGMFTIVYAVFLGMTGSDDKFRFIIGLLGLLAAIGIGYVKFVRPRTEQATS